MFVPPALPVHVPLPVCVPLPLAVLVSRGATASVSSSIYSYTGSTSATRARTNSEIYFGPELPATLRSTTIIV